MANLVDAGNFSSWSGRGIQGRVKKLSEHDGVERSSAETIDFYAGIAGEEEMPPIEMAIAYIQPNGLVLFSASHGAHRAAAALKRGDKYLAVQNLSIYLIDQDIFQIANSNA
jgi:hypothetical protein